MATVRCDGVSVELAPGEKVLDGLLRAGVKVPHSCRAGACQSCMMKATAGTPPAAAQVGLKETLRAQGYFLACSAALTEDLTVTLTAGDALSVPARIADIERLSGDVVRLRLRTASRFDYRSGQFVNLARPDGLVRSYSVASLPDRDDHIELHVREIPGGRMSLWLARDAKIGDALEVRGPAGDCFYVPGRPEQDMLLIGTGTGLAPLYGIVQDALRNHHTGMIRLFHGALEPRGLYLVDELLALAAHHTNFAYHRCVLKNPDALPGVETGSIDQIVSAVVPSVKNTRVFLCGNPELVTTLRKKMFMAGAKMAEIHADAFVMAKPTAA